MKKLNIEFPDETPLLHKKVKTLKGRLCNQVNIDGSRDMVPKNAIGTVVSYGVNNGKLFWLVSFRIDGRATILKAWFNCDSLNVVSK